MRLIRKFEAKTKKFLLRDTKIHPILYHYTNKESARNILQHNYFRTSPGVINLRGLSTTYNSKYKWGSAEICFELDSAVLFRDFTLMYVDEELPTKNGKLQEFEVKIICDSAILNASNYILDVYEVRNREKFYWNESAQKEISCSSFLYRGYRVKPLPHKYEFAEFFRSYQDRLAPFFITGPFGVFVGFGSNKDPWLTYFPDRDETHPSEALNDQYDKNLLSYKDRIDDISSKDYYKFFLTMLIDREILNLENYVIESLRNGWTKTK